MFPNFSRHVLPAVLLLSMSGLPLTTGATSAEQLKLTDITGKYTYKSYRKGRGGFENHLEITPAAKGRLHLSFELTYFYMAGRNETFHEGSGEGDGELHGNVLTAMLSDGAGGSCRVTLTVNETMMAHEYTLTIKSTHCELNVVPDGLYRKNAPKRPATNRAASTQVSAVEKKLPPGFLRH